MELKRKIEIGSVILCCLLIVGLLVFSGSKKYEDSHLRKEGKRVRVGEYALVVDDCDEKTSNVALCNKTISLNNEDVLLKFDLIDIKDSGFPSTLVATINGHEFLRRTNIDIEKNGNADFQVFKNFQVINDNIITFTYTDGTAGRTTTLYALDQDGNIILEDKMIDKEDMVIKDFNDFYSFKDGVITIRATRMNDNLEYKGESVCKAKDKDIVEADYTYTYQNNKFIKKQKNPMTAAEYRESVHMICQNED